MFGDLLSPGHLVVVLVVALLVFGPRRLPELGKSLGSGMRGFRDAVSGESGADEPSSNEREELPPVSPGADRGLESCTRSAERERAPASD